MSALGRLVASIVLDSSEFTGGIDKAKFAAADAATSIDRAMRDMQRGVSSALDSLAGRLAAGFGIAALVAMAKSALDSGEELRHAAEKAGMAVEQFSALNFAAKQSGVSMDSLEAGTKKLNVAIAEAVGGGPKFTQVFKTLGVDINSSSNSSEGFNKVLLQLSDTFAKSEDGPTKVAAAVKIFGKNGAEMIPLLNQGSEAIKKMQTEALELGRVLGTDAAANVHKFHEDVDKLTSRSTYLAQVLGSTVLPSVTDIVEAMIQGRKEGGLYEMAIRGVAEALSLIKGEGPKAELAKITDQINLARSAAQRLQEQSWLNFGGLGQYVEQAARLNGLLQQRAVIEHGIFMDEIADQDRRAIAGQMAARRRPLPNVSGADATTAPEWTKATDNLVASLEKEIAKLTTTVGENRKYAEVLIEIAKLKKEGVPVDEERIKNLAIEIDLLTGAIAAEKAVADGYDKMVAAARVDIDQMVMGNRQLAFENSLIGLGTDARALAIVQKQKEIAVDKARGTGLDEITAKTYDERLAIIAAGQAMNDQAKFWTDVSAKAGQFFGDLIVNGKSAFDRLRTELKSFVQDLLALFAQKWVLQMVAGVMGSTALGATAANLGASTVAGGLLQGAPGTGLFGGLLGAGSAIGDFSAGLASGAMVYAPGSAGAIGSSIASAIGITIPVLGQIALAVGALAAILSQRPGGPKDGGSFYGGFSAGGTFLGNQSVPGSDNGRYFTPSGQDASVAAIGQATASSFYAAMRSLGLSGRALSFGLGFDTDPQGTAPNRISSAVRDASGNLIYGSQDRSIGRDNAQIQPELQLEASRMLLAAIRSSSLPAYLSRVFDGLTPSTATQAQIDAALAQATALRSIFDVVSRNPLRDLATTMDAQMNPFQSALRTNATAISTAISAYDRTTTSTQNLATATTNYYNSQMQLIVGIQQARQAIGDMFDATFRNIRLAGLDGNQAKYDFYQREAADLQRQALASNDPATIQRLAGIINQDINAAFSLLTPEQQRAQSAQFLSQGQNTQSAIDARLERLQRAAADATQTVLNQIRDLIGASNTAMTGAAADVRAGGNNILIAARTPLQVVFTMPNGNQVTAIR